MVNRTAKIATLLAGAWLAAAALAGCTSSPADTPTAAAPPHAAHAAAVAVESPTPEPSYAPDECRPTKNGVYDRGPREGARGEVTRDSNSDPIAYTVAAGDGQQPISARFCIPNVATLNADFLYCPPNNHVLHPGDVLSLDPAAYPVQECPERHE
ncbi:hypothetical protein [Microbacterium luticocti]|uniref:hypothetical protein n=1 Tax=Microbacterium luticocti TaxID=451764 RepID=UPI00048D8DA2|nr:hypothetical protein [Microbacterium luticocti]